MLVPGPRVHNAAVDDLDLSVDDTRCGEFAHYSHGRTRFPGVKVAVEEPHMGGGDVGVSMMSDGSSHGSVDSGLVSCLAWAGGF